jgi:hypothetical protein
MMLEELKLLGLLDRINVFYVCAGPEFVGKQEQNAVGGTVAIQIHLLKP